MSRNARRDDLVWCHLLLPGGGLVAGIAVAGAVRNYDGDAVLCLPQQAWRLDRIFRVSSRETVDGALAGVGVQGKVELAPLLPGAAVFLCIPLALPEQPQARAVQN